MALAAPLVGLPTTSFFNGNKDAAVIKSCSACAQISAWEDFYNGNVDGDCDAVRRKGASLNSFPNWNR